LSAGLCPDPLGELTVLPRPPSWIRDPTSKEEEGRSGEERRGEERGGEEKGGEGGKALGPAPLHIIFGYATGGLYLDGYISSNFLLCLVAPSF